MDFFNKVLAWVAVGYQINDKDAREPVPPHTV